jgi:hypothetical protein
VVHVEGRGNRCQHNGISRPYAFDHTVEAAAISCDAYYTLGDSREYLYKTNTVSLVCVASIGCLDGSRNGLLSATEESSEWSQLLTRPKLVCTTLAIPQSTMSSMI